MLYEPYKPELYFFESVMMLQKLILIVALVFTSRGSQMQHAAVLLVCTIQLGVHTRLEPYKKRGENLLQYASSIVSFALAFGGLLIAYIELSDQESSLRVRGERRGERRHPVCVPLPTPRQITGKRRTAKARI